MANEITTQSLAADLVPLYIRDELLERGEEQLVLGRFGMDLGLPQGQGKTIQATRYERLSLPESPLTEGVTPATPAALTLSQVQATVDQWGDYLTMTDVSQLTVKHPTFRIGTELLGEQRAETFERQIQRTLEGLSAVRFPNSKTSRDALVAADVINTTVIREALARLRNNGARTFPDGFYRLIVDPSVEQDLNADPTFVQAATGAANRLAEVGGGGLVSGEVGTWMGTRVFRSNFLPTIDILTGVTPAANTTIPGGEAGFAAASTVLVKVTKLDPRTKQEVLIADEVAVTNIAAFVVNVAFVVATTGVGTFNIYVSLEGGVVPTFQRRVTITADTTFTFFKSGASSNPVLRQAVSATGAVAPPDAPGGGVIVHTSYIFGRNAYGVTTLSGGLRTSLTSGESPSDSDPLAQRRHMGWKQIFKPLILNNEFIERIESASNF